VRQAALRPRLRKQNAPQRPHHNGQTPIHRLCEHGDAKAAAPFLLLIKELQIHARVFFEEQTGLVETLVRRFRSLDQLPLLVSLIEWASASGLRCLRDSPESAHRLVHNLVDAESLGGAGLALALV
jgi:hypothetical protein